MLKYFSILGFHVLKISVEAGTFSAAAQILNITQPAVSAHIHRLEEELNVKIFERPYGRKLQLTKAGELVYSYAIEMLIKNEELQKATREFITGELGEVKLAIGNGRCIIPSILLAFRKRYPGVNFIIRGGNSTRVQQLVINGDVDFGLSLYTENPKIKFKLFYQEPHIMVCSSDHPLASQKRVSKEDINKYGIFSGLQGSELNSFIANSFVANGIHNLNIIAQVEEPEIVLKLVKEGGGISLLPQSALQPYIEKGEIVKLSFENNLIFPTMKVYQLFRQEARLSTTVQLFIDFLYAEIPKRFPFVTLIQQLDED